MFGLISKKKLKAFMDYHKEVNRAECLGQYYGVPITETQKDKNIYAQGYEDGTDNFFNSLCHKFNIKRNGRRGVMFKTKVTTRQPKPVIDNDPRQRILPLYKYMLRSDNNAECNER